MPVEAPTRPAPPAEAPIKSPPYIEEWPVKQPEQPEQPEEPSRRAPCNPFEDWPDA